LIAGCRVVGFTGVSLILPREEGRRRRRRRRRKRRPSHPHPPNSTQQLQE